MEFRSTSRDYGHDWAAYFQNKTFFGRGAPSPSERDVRAEYKRRSLMVHPSMRSQHDKLALATAAFQQLQKYAELAAESGYRPPRRAGPPPRRAAAPPRRRAEPRDTATPMDWAPTPPASPGRYPAYSQPIPAWTPSRGGGPRPAAARGGGVAKPSPLRRQTRRPAAPLRPRRR